MPKISGYQIKQFKGIENVAIAVEGGRTPGRFVTLVGLNESGKTSIIEALSLSVLQDPNTADLLKATNVATDLSVAVPKHLSAGFTGDFEVSVTVDFTEDEDVILAVRKAIKDAGFSIVRNFSPKIVINKKYQFKDSVYVDFSTTWNFLPQVKKVGGRKIASLHDHAKPVWLQCLNIFKVRLPQSIYFPTFLIDFPRRIYLEGDYGVIDKHYRNIVSDALNSLKNPLSLDRHILDRVKKHRDGAVSFSSSLRSSAEGRQIDDVVQALASEINFVVFGAWNEIFGKKIDNRRIVVEWHIDENQGYRIYLEFYIIAGDYRFAISERSLGFRWFFSFLLFTQFQKSRASNRKLVFLFDEPASHLHPKAQERLLKSFERIAEPNHVIIYSTHSHYLINPLWLEQCNVISNSALDADNDETGIDSVGSRVTISSSPYKSFVSTNPGKTTYYQPILDVIDYTPGSLSLSDPVVVLEGKYDYFPFQYFVKKLNNEAKFKIIPSVGAGGLSALIGLLRGWGIRFLIILDDDEAGRKEKAKYKRDLMLGELQVITVDEIDQVLSGKEFEDIYQQDVITACAASGFKDSKGKVGKQEIYSYFQQILFGKIVPADFLDTTVFVEKILEVIDKKLKEQR